MSVVGSLEWRVDVSPELTWEDAKAYAAAQGDGWRLPTITELFGLVDHARNGPACSLIPDMPLAFFWSSSAYGLDPACAWAVNFGDGSVSGEDRGYSLWVRLVRDVKPTVDDVPDTVAAAGGRAPTNWERVLCAGVEQLTRDRDAAYLRGVEAMRVAANRAEAERDALRAEVERLRAALAEPADCRECEIESKSHALTRWERDGLSRAQHRLAEAIVRVRAEITAAEGEGLIGGTHAQRTRLKALVADLRDLAAVGLPLPEDKP